MSSTLSLSRPGFQPSFTGLFDALCRLGEASPVGRAVDALNAETDADLLARGTTRQLEVRRIFAGRFY